VFVEKGMKHGDKITFKEEGDQFPDIIPGMLSANISGRNTQISFSCMKYFTSILIFKKASETFQ
jgi:hypothetical protein